MVSSGQLVLEYYNGFFQRSPFWNTIIVDLVTLYQHSVFSLPEHFSLHTYILVCKNIMSHTFAHSLLLSFILRNMLLGQWGPIHLYGALLPLAIVNRSGCTPRGEATGLGARELSRPLADEGKDSCIFLF